MKSIILSLVAMYFFNSSFCQVFKVNEVFSSAFIKLSHWKVISKTEKPVVDSFYLWDKRQYSESLSSDHEVNYYRADVKTTFEFLNELIAFTENYRRENNIVAFIKGVRIKTVKGRVAEHIEIYDSEQKITGYVNLKQLILMRENFLSYCKDNNILIEKAN